MQISVVTSLYKTAPYLDALYNRLIACLRRLRVTYEVFFVNDASPDDCHVRAQAIAALNEHVHVVSLQRNVGQDRALIHGISLSQGELVFVLDSDLEEAPEWLIRFYSAQRKTGADIVYGVPFSRPDRGLLYAAGSQLFYMLMECLYVSPSPKNQVMARLMSRCFADALVRYDEGPVEFASVCSVIPGKRTVVPVWKPYKGVSGYHTMKKIALFCDCVRLADKPWIRKWIVS